jgi:hypothetical protein
MCPSEPRRMIGWGHEFCKTYDGTMPYENA